MRLSHLLREISFANGTHDDRCLAQSTGVLVINNYQVLLYNGLGLTGYLPLLLYGIYTLWAAFLNWAGSMFVDRFGRIRMLIIGCVSTSPPSPKIHTANGDSLIDRMLPDALLRSCNASSIWWNNKQCWPRIRCLFSLCLRNLLRKLR